jgi:tRNA nucleotidyltransferase (CCA-adding enzyme)
LPTALSRLQHSAGHSDDPQVRFATLMVSLGADLDTARRLQQAESLCERYRVPNDYSRLALLAIRLADRVDRRNADAALDMMQAATAFRDPARWEQLLAVYRFCGLIDQAYADTLDTARRAACQISAASLDASGLDGPALGEAIAKQRRQVIEGVLLQAGK